jgi:hypothetical protein
METIYYSLTDGINAYSIEVYESYKSPSARASVITDDYGGLGLGDAFSIDMGFDSSHGTVFNGYIQNINSERLPGQHIIEAQDVLIKASEHLIVSTDLDNPFRRWKISAEDLVEDLLNEAGITSYSANSPGFTFATGEIPVEFQLVFAWDAIQMVANVVAWHVWADTSGTVHFEDIDPVPNGSSKTYDTGNSGTIVVARRSTSTDSLRNKVVVFGFPPIKAEASAASPYLPANFYKTAVISSTLIDTQPMADTTASYNLSKWNRLTETMSIETEGDHSVHVRDTVTVNESYTGSSDKWFVNDIQHVLAETYVTRLNLVK